MAYLDTVDISSLARRETGKLDDRKRLALWSALLMSIPVLGDDTPWKTKSDMRRYFRACHRIAKSWKAASDKCITAGAIPAAERLGAFRLCDVAERADVMKEIGR